MMEIRLLLAVAGAFALGYVLGGMVEVAKIIALTRALDTFELTESRGDLSAILKED